jgi:hypothetical protein
MHKVFVFKKMSEKNSDSKFYKKGKEVSYEEMLKVDPSLKIRFVNLDGERVDGKNFKLILPENRGEILFTLDQQDPQNPKLVFSNQQGGKKVYDLARLPEFFEDIKSLVFEFAFLKDQVNPNAWNQKKQDILFLNKNFICDVDEFAKIEHTINVANEQEEFRNKINETSFKIADEISASLQMSGGKFPIQTPLTVRRAMEKLGI